MGDKRGIYGEDFGKNWQRNTGVTFRILCLNE